MQNTGNDYLNIYIFQVLNSCMSRSLELSANDKTTTKLTEDFYQSVFDPFKHTTLQESLSDLVKNK